MKIDSKKLIRQLTPILPYILIGLVATNLGEAWRLSTGEDASQRIISLMATIPMALSNPMPSFHVLDLLIGTICGGGIRLAVWAKSKNAKNYKHNIEYGSARWSA